MANEIAALAEAVRLLERRVASLEAQGGESFQPASTAGTDTFWALDAINGGLAGEPREVVMFAGRVQLEEGPVEWQQESPSEAVLGNQWEGKAGSLSALGNPVRLELLRNILNGTHRTADLANLDMLGTTGQLHHHLRQLVEAGWLAATARGYYEVPASRVIPLMACIIAIG